MTRLIAPAAAAALALFAVSCAKVKPTEEAAFPADPQDHHTYSNPAQIRMTNVDLLLDVDFDRKVLSGAATLAVARDRDFRTGPLVLDTRDLTIHGTECSTDLVEWNGCAFELGHKDPILGSPLTIHLPDSAKFVRIRYTTSPAASGLQWLSPAQTAGRKLPFLFSQSQSIHARSWAPVQDSPGVRFTYSARVRTPKALTAVMSAERQTLEERAPEYMFRMPQAIPAYLMAIAVGDLYSKTTGKRTGVWAEKPLLEAAAREFDDAERMIQAAEVLYGQYRWDRYDMLVLPPSFPFGGMENARLTFVTPTLITGDKSLVETIAHEIAHSWSGNLVTNATWRDFWLNEGFTTYLTMRIQERVFGPERADMEAVLARRGLEDELQRLPARDQVLYIDLKGRDPDEASSEVPYVKGMLLLRLLEQTFGRDRFDMFLRGYFQQFAFQSITTAQFVDLLRTGLFPLNPEAAKTLRLEEWLTKPGLPSNAPKFSSSALDRVEEAARRFSSGSLSASALPARQWSTPEWLFFLRSLPREVGSARLAELDASFGVTKKENSEIAAQWLLMAVRAGYEPAYPRLEQFLMRVGRRKYIQPLYEELLKTPAGRKRAQAIYIKARPGYHPIAQTALDAVVK